MPVRPRETLPTGALQLDAAPLLSQLGGSVLRSAPVDDALMSDAGIRALIEGGHLHEAEGELALSMQEGRRGTFVAGRMALRQAMREGAAASWTDTLHTTPFLRTLRGAPHLPDAVTGSVSHKRTLALAAVASRGLTTPVGLLEHVGVDLERRPTATDLSRPSIATRILTPQETDWLRMAADNPLREREAVLVHFAVKEAIYKAIDPFVHRYVRFTEVELDRPVDADSGEATVKLLLPELQTGEVAVRAQWHLDGDWIVATAYSARAGELVGPNGTRLR